MTAATVVLASTSRYRAELLRRLLPAFDTLRPDVDETARSGEGAAALAARLARAKALAGAARRPGTLVIGSDQAADRGGIVLGKPGDAAAARAQLAATSGAVVAFHTAVCLVDARVAPARELADADVTRVHFRVLDAAAIARYVEREQPFDCAGSFKAEGLGIALFERIESHDPTALIGLPLIALARLLRAAGLDVI